MYMYICNQHLQVKTCLNIFLHVFPLKRKCIFISIDKPSVIINNPNPMVVTENNNLTISCSSDGNPSVTEMCIVSGSRHVLNRCNKLQCAVTVFKIKREEAGSFKCVARNIIGMVEEVVEITVQCKYDIKIIYSGILLEVLC